MCKPNRKGVNGVCNPMRSNGKVNATDKSTRQTSVVVLHGKGGRETVCVKVYAVTVTGKKGGAVGNCRQRTATKKRKGKP